ncbi:MAG: hypothetical protein U0572_12165 [Phycisphaerales bacterium]
MVSNGADGSANDFGTDAWADRLRLLLDDRAALLAQLEAVSARQDEIIERRDPDELGGLLAARQAVVDRFVAGQAELLEMTGTLDQHATTLPAGDSDELRRRIRSLADGLRRATERDDAAHEALRRARDDARVSLQRTSTGAGARAAYAARGTGEATFADRRG